MSITINSTTGPSLDAAFAIDERRVLRFREEHDLPALDTPLLGRKPGLVKRVWWLLFGEPASMGDAKLAFRWLEAVVRPEDAHLLEVMPPAQKVRAWLAFEAAQKAWSERVRAEQWADAHRMIEAARGPVRGPGTASLHPAREMVTKTGPKTQERVTSFTLRDGEPMPDAVAAMGGAKP